MSGSNLGGGKVLYGARDAVEFVEDVGLGIADVGVGTVARPALYGVAKIMFNLVTAPGSNLSLQLILF